MVRWAWVILAPFSLVDPRENASGGAIFSDARENSGKESAMGRGSDSPPPWNPHPTAKGALRRFAGKCLVSP